MLLLTRCCAYFLSIYFYVNQWLGIIVLPVMVTVPQKAMHAAQLLLAAGCGAPQFYFQYLLPYINKPAIRNYSPFRNFITHQKKGGIHAIYRFIMEAFGWYRLTGLLHRKYLSCLSGISHSIR